MSKVKQTANESVRTTPPIGWVGLIAVVVAFFLYGPALKGPFLFDDIGLPFYQLSFPHESLRAWLAGVRPILMLSYWVNYQVSARDPWSYHALNVLLHAANTVLVYALFSRLLRILDVERRKALFCSIVAAAVFLVHPIETEAVAYIAGRSELVCGLFVLSALVVFSKPEVTTLKWRQATVILALYGAAVLSKEQAVVLPAVFLVIDLVVRRRTLRELVRRGSRLYVPVAILGVIATIGVGVLLTRSTTAGFHVPGIEWYEYLFTQFRMWIFYVGLAVLPFWQNADYDISLSHNLVEHGAGLALALLIATAIITWRLRNRFPLLFAGALIFALLLAPTSSIVPIQDLAAERRLYIPIIGLLLIATQALIRVKTETVTIGLFVYLLLCSALTYERSKVWGSDVAFWNDVIKQSPGKPRAYSHLAYAYIRERRCPEAVNTALQAPSAARETPEFLGMLGNAYTCDQRLPEAVTAYERAVLAGPSVGRMLALASSYRNVGRMLDAQAAEQQAMRLTPRTAYDFFMLEAWKTSKEQSTRSRSALTRKGG